MHFKDSTVSWSACSGGEKTRSGLMTFRNRFECISSRYFRIELQKLGTTAELHVNIVQRAPKVNDCLVFH